MLDQELASLEHALARDPGDPDALVALARLAERLGADLLELDRDASLPALLERWAEDPGERALGALALPLLGLEPRRPRREDPPLWWARRDRVGDGEDQWFDRESGLPLEVRRRVDGAPMSLVASEEDLFYVDRYELTVARYRVFLGETGNPQPSIWQSEKGDQLRDPARPVVCVSWQDACAYGAWAGGRPPEVREWLAAAGTDDEFPWGGETARPGKAVLNFDSSGRLEGRWDECLRPVEDAEAGESPFGVVGLVGNVFEWCLDPARGGPSTIGCGYMFRPTKAHGWRRPRRREVSRIPNGDTFLGFRLVVPVSLSCG